MCVGCGTMLHVLAHITLGDGLGLGTLGTRVVGNCGLGTHSVEVPMASEFVAPRQSIGRIISRCFCLAWVQAMDSLVEA